MQIVGFPKRRLNFDKNNNYSLFLDLVYYKNHFISICRTLFVICVAALENQQSAYTRLEPKAQISFAVTAKLISATDSIFPLNPKFPASVFPSSLLCLCQTCFENTLLVFSRGDSFFTTHFCLFRVGCTLARSATGKLC